jgi:hypothetical protein
MVLLRPHLAFAAVPACLVRLACCAALAPALASPAFAQQPAAAPQVQQSAPQQAAGNITEAELKQHLTGKALYLRGCYLDNTLTFDEHGGLIGHSPQGSYTLSVLQIDKVRLTKHKLQLEGIRYGLHFLGQLAFEEPSSAFDRVRITPKKKVVKITIDREMVVKPKKVKEAATGKEQGRRARLWPWATANTAAPAAPQPTQPPELSEAEQLKASIAATPEAYRPVDPNSVTTTTSPAHAARVLRDALDRIFAQGIDQRMIAAMPSFWQLYYQAVADGTDYRPRDPAIFRQNAVDQQARLLTTFEPDSNEFAQADGVAGMAQYHAIIGSDGKVGEIAVGRPIGFGLDEIAVAAIKESQFAPAIKDGKPVPVMIDLDVPFRIFSKRTDVHSPPGESGKPAALVLPGPYSLPQ